MEAKELRQSTINVKPEIGNKITLDDVIFMLQPNPPSIDPETANSLRKFKISIMERRIHKVNQMKDFFLSVWPSGNPIEYYIAMELAGDDQQLLAEKLTHHDFFRTVSSELNARLASSKKKDDEGQPMYFLDLIDPDDQDDLFEEAGKQTKKSRGLWSQVEIEKFKELYYHRGPFRNWKAVAKHFPNKTQAQCKALYHKLQQTGEIGRIQNSERIENSDGSEIFEEIDGEISDSSSIHSLIFVYQDKNAIVGPKSRLYETMSALNPIPGYIDQITMQPMTMPAVSPDGYVLDYSTWIKLLNEKKVNPFTQNHMKSKRELTLLSIDNFDALKKSIVNLEECRPPDNSM